VDTAHLRLAVIGLGYVGLPLAVEFGKRRAVVGFDVKEERLEELRRGSDRTLEVSSEELREAVHLSFSGDLEALRECNCYIVTVPTPIDANKKPDLGPLLSASESVGGLLKKGDLVIYESTVYPGCTEEDCVPVLEEYSGLRFNQDFFCGYSPERINPGDKQHRLTDIKKVTSGSTPEIADLVDRLYSEIISAGTHKASSIKVAEAAKVIENTQRDVNIALVNEFAMIFNRMNIDTQAVLEAAGTKWNFLPFRPGLVGGHCIGVDPYYLTYKAQKIGYEPEVILAGRRLNDSMGIYVADRVFELLSASKDFRPGKPAQILIMGVTFKENCPDVRSSQIVKLRDALEERGCEVTLFDPVADSNQTPSVFGSILIDHPKEGFYDGIVLAVRHKVFIEMTAAEIKSFGKPSAVIYDVKNVLPREEVDACL